MSARFLTDFEQPVKVGAYPQQVSIPVAANAPASLFCERRYLDAWGALLEVQSDPVPQSAYGKVITCNLNSDYLLNAASVEVVLSDTDQSSAATGDRVSHAVAIAEPTLTRFMSDLAAPVLVEDYANGLALIVPANAPQPLYFERRYLDAWGEELEIRSTLIPANKYGGRVWFNLRDIMLSCADAVQVSLRSDNRQYFGSCDGEPVPDTRYFDFTFDESFE